MNVFTVLLAEFELLTAAGREVKRSRAGLISVLCLPLDTGA